MFRSYPDHLQGAHMFLVKVTDFKICYKCKSQCGQCILCEDVCRTASLAHIFTQNARTHTKCYAAASPYRLSHF